MLAPPERLVTHNAEQLARFGYAPSAEIEPDWSGMWALLKPDFAASGQSQLPAYEDMSPQPRAAARIYMRRRLLADRLFEDTRLLYAELHRRGVDAELVEAYTLAREAYEASVYEFGAARQVLEDILRMQGRDS